MLHLHASKQTDLELADSYALWLCSRGYTDATVAGYLRLYHLWERWCRVQGFAPARASRAHIARWLLERRDRAPSTIRNSVIGLRAFYTFAVSTEVRQDDPTAGLRWPKVSLPSIRPYDRAEILALLEGARLSRDRALIWLLLGSGLRISEAVGIEARDIDWERGTIRIRHGKGNRQRLVVPGERAMAALRDYGGAGDGTLWGVTSADVLRRQFFRLAKRAGVERANFHRFRHTFASAFLLAGGSEGQLQKILGHRSLAMSLHYGEAARETVALEAQRRFNPADRL